MHRRCVWQCAVCSVCVCVCVSIRGALSPTTPTTRNVTPPDHTVYNKQHKMAYDLIDSSSVHPTEVSAWMRCLSLHYAWCMCERVWAATIPTRCLLSVPNYWRSPVFCNLFQHRIILVCPLWTVPSDHRPSLSSDPNTNSEVCLFVRRSKSSHQSSHPPPLSLLQTRNEPRHTTFSSINSLIFFHKMRTIFIKCCFCSFVLANM